MVNDKRWMVNHAGWMAIGVTVLLLQGCTPQGPSGAPVRMFAADLAGAARNCTSPAVTPVAGQTKDAALKVGNSGGWCAITVSNSGRPFDAGLLIAQPVHGKVLIHTVGNNTRIDYTPEAHFAGADAFSVKLIPGDGVIRTSVTVAPG